MQDNVRQIAPISIAGLNLNKPSSGMPIFELVRPASLYVDPAYQRNISDKGHKQIRRILQNFDWQNSSRRSAPMRLWKVKQSSKYLTGNTRRLQPQVILTYQPSP